MTVAKGLGLVIAAVLLSGCINYVGMHTQAKPLNAQALIINQNHRTTSLTTNTLGPDTNWWLEYHDPVLNQLIALSLQNQPNIKLAEARCREAAQLANAAGANNFPTVSLGGDAYRLRYSGTAIFPPPIGGTWYYLPELTANFSYQVDFWGKNYHTFKAALSRAQAAQADVAAGSLMLSSAVAEAYYQLRGYNTLIKLAQDNLQDQIELQNLQILQAKAGVVSSFPVDQARQTLASTQIALTQLQNARQLIIDQLNALIAVPFATDQITQPLMINKMANPLPKYIPLNLISRRPDLAALCWRVQAAQNEISVAKADFYPNINLTAFIGLQSIGFNNLLLKNSEEGSIGPAINLPIFDAGRIRANFGLKNAEYDIAVDQYNQGLLTAIQQTADALTNLQSTIKQQQSQALLLNAIQRNYQYTKVQYRAGIIDQLTLLQMQQQVLQQQQQAATLAVQYQVDKINLIQALGGGYLAKQT